jgi:hypothetical protein
VTILFVAVHGSLVGTFRTSQDVRLESAKWGKADLDQVAVTNRNFMSTRPSTTLADSVYAAILPGPIVGSSGSAEAVA